MQGDTSTGASSQSVPEAFKRKLKTKLENKPNERTFYFVANQLLIFSEKVQPCLLCRSIKKHIGKPRSHIFPEALLLEYGKIHCSSYEKCKKYILDVSECANGHRRLIAPSQLSFPMFCNKCESSASDEEEFLLKKYREIMQSGSKEDITFEKEEYFKLIHILAILMFRGALLAINFHQEVFCSGYSSSFFETFMMLQNFCLIKGQYDKCTITERFCLFLLRNDEYHPNCNYTIDYQIRNPQFTTIAHSSEGKPFLYMKFDCFHCVLPLNDNIIKELTDVPQFKVLTSDKISIPLRAGKDFPGPLFWHNLISEPEKLLSCISDSQFPKNVVIAQSRTNMKKPSLNQLHFYPSVKHTLLTAPITDAQNFSPIRDVKFAKTELKRERENSEILKKEIEKLDRIIKELTEENEKLNRRVKELTSTIQKEPDIMPPTNVIPVEESSSATALVQRLLAPAFHTASVPEKTPEKY